MISPANCSSQSLFLLVHIHITQDRVVTEPVDLVVVKGEALLLRQTERTVEWKLGAHVVLRHPGLTVGLHALLIAGLVTLLSSHQITPATDQWSELKITP